MNGINTIVLAAKLPKTENIDILIISISNTINADDKIKHTIDIHCDRKYLKCVGPYSKTSDLTIIYAADHQAAIVSIIHDTIIINYDSSIIKYVAVFDTDTEVLNICNTRTGLLQIIKPYFESAPDTVNKPISVESTILFDMIYPIAQISVDSNNVAVIKPIIRVIDTGEYGVIDDIGISYYLNSTVAIDNLKREVENLKSRLDIDVVEDRYVITDSIYDINITVSCDATLDGGAPFYCYNNNNNMRIYGIINDTTANDSETIDINIYRMDSNGALALVVRKELDILGIVEDNHNETN